ASEGSIDWVGPEIWSDVVAIAMAAEIEGEDSHSSFVERPGQFGPALFMTVFADRVQENGALSPFSRVAEIVSALNRNGIHGLKLNPPWLRWPCCGWCQHENRRGYECIRMRSKLKTSHGGTSGKEMCRAELILRQQCDEVKLRPLLRSFPHKSN